MSEWFLESFQTHKLLELLLYDPCVPLRLQKHEHFI